MNNDIEPEDILEELDGEGLLTVKNEELIRKSLCEICSLMVEHLGQVEKEYLDGALKMSRSKLSKVPSDNDSDAWAIHGAATTELKKDLWRAIICCYSSLEPEHEIPNVITICIDYSSKVLGDDARGQAAKILINNFSDLRK